MLMTLHISSHTTLSIYSKRVQGESTTRVATLLTLGVHAQRGLRYLLCVSDRLSVLSVCLSVCYHSSVDITRCYVQNSRLFLDFVRDQREVYAHIAMTIARESLSRYHSHTNPVIPRCLALFIHRVHRYDTTCDTDSTGWRQENS